MSLTAITVNFTYKRTSGSNAAGTVRFVPKSPYTDGSTIEERTPQTVTLVNGAGSVVLEVEPPSTQFYVTESIVDSPPHTYLITVSSATTPVALGSLM